MSPRSRLGRILYRYRTPYLLLLPNVVYLVGFTMARYAFPGRRFLALALLLSPMFQGPPVMIPFYRILSTLKLLNTIPGQVLARIIRE